MTERGKNVIMVAFVVKEEDEKYRRGQEIIFSPLRFPEEILEKNDPSNEF